MGKLSSAIIKRLVAIARFTLLALLFGLMALPIQAEVTLTAEQLGRIGQQIYRNETGGKAQYLVTWNNNEAFASLGIGHFIWFPESLQSRFTESFPDLLAYLERQGIELPTWLAQNRDCPWSTREAFFAAKDSQQMRDLRRLLTYTKAEQVAFIHQRLKLALPTMLDHAPNAETQASLKSVFTRLTQTELGLYALIDYVNFKGEGTALTERYNGYGWGLMQVLESISAESDDLHREFSLACDKVLSRRVQNAPNPSVEKRWLAGWRKRCNTYHKPIP